MNAVDNDAMGDVPVLYSFIITSPKGIVLDFGTYFHEQCARDAALDNTVWKGCRLTIMKHDDDGSAEFVTGRAGEVIR